MPSSTLAEPTFDRLANTDLYWLTDSSRTIAFQATQVGRLGDKPTVTQTWTQDPAGIYIFLGQSPADEAAFALELDAYVSEHRWPPSPRMLWISDPRPSQVEWSAESLWLRPEGQGWAVADPATFAFGRYALHLYAGQVSHADQKLGWGFAVTGSAAVFHVHDAWYPVADGVLWVPLVGPDRASWRFALHLPNGTQPETDFDRLDVGVRYFSPGLPTVPPGQTPIRALALQPIAQPTDKPLLLHAALDVNRPLAADRTHLSFFGPGETDGPGALRSAFATATGHGVTLTPEAATAATPDARLVFAVQPLAIEADGRVRSEYYLTLNGAFKIGWPRSAAGGASAPPFHRLLCGLSGLEYLGLPLHGASSLVFAPGHAAYASLQPTAQASDPALTTAGTTAWTYLKTTGGAASYYTQPEDSPLFGAPAVPEATAARAS